jgi:membrane protein implicated in regulation of membrane protease activity
MNVSGNKPRQIDGLIRTWTMVAAAVVAWVLPIPWYFSVALFLVALFALGIFYPALRARPRK